VGTIYHYGFGRVAPYPWWDLPQILGTVGGIALAAGTGGLLAAKRKRLPDMVEPSTRGMDTAFTLMLHLTAVTGLALHFLALTPAMELLLALHLGVVFALFLTMPYGKFVHGLYRFAALCRLAMARRHGLKSSSASMRDSARAPAPSRG
jgi:citrate/tricarballylate utilization protein